MPIFVIVKRQYMHSKKILPLLIISFTLDTPSILKHYQKMSISLDQICRLFLLLFPPRNTN